MSVLFLSLFLFFFTLGVNSDCRKSEKCNVLELISSMTYYYVRNVYETIKRGKNNNREHVRLFLVGLRVRIRECVLSRIPRCSARVEVIKPIQTYFATSRIRVCIYMYICMNVYTYIRVLLLSPPNMYYHQFRYG